MSYELPDTIADGAPIEPCGTVMFRRIDGRNVTEEEYSDSKEWLSALKTFGPSYNDDRVK